MKNDIIDQLEVVDGKITMCIINNEIRKDLKGKSFGYFLRNYLGEYMNFVDSRLEKMEKNSKLVERKKNETN